MLEVSINKILYCSIPPPATNFKLVFGNDRVQGIGGAD